MEVIDRRIKYFKAYLRKRKGTDGQAHMTLKALGKSIVRFLGSI